jgi:hypothetical protein
VDRSRIIGKSNGCAGHNPDGDGGAPDRTKNHKRKKQNPFFHKKFLQVKK